MKLPKLLTQKTFGVPNWIIGVVGVAGAYVYMNGFPSLNSTTSDITNPYNRPLDDAGQPCPTNRIVKAQAGNLFCCPYVPGPSGDCSP